MLFTITFISLIETRARAANGITLAQRKRKLFSQNSSRKFNQNIGHLAVSTSNRYDRRNSVDRRQHLETMEGNRPYAGAMVGMTSTPMSEL